MPEGNDSGPTTPEADQEEQKKPSTSPPKPRFPHSPTTLNGWEDRARDAMKRVLEHKKEEGDEEEGEGSEDK